MKLVLVFSIVFTVAYVYETNKSINTDEGISAKIVTKLLENYEYEPEQKEELLNLAQNSLGNSIVIVFFASFLISLFLATILDVVTLSAFGLLTCFVAKIKINYKAIFNMSIYALTLSIILKMIYWIVRLFSDFNIKYFDIMYTSVAYIILAAAIFIIKSDVIKQQIQLMNVLEQSKEKLEETLRIPEEPKEKKDEKEEEEEEEKEKKEKDPNSRRLRKRRRS